MSHGATVRKQIDSLSEWTPPRKKPLYVSEWRTPHRLGLEGYRRCAGVPRVRFPDFSQIEAAIGASHKLVDLPENWDDEGAAQIPRTTWELAANVLRVAARTAQRRFGYVLPAPTIGPCADGSIDLYWGRGPDFTLLINVKAGDGETSDYYGERQKTRIQGPFNPKQPNLDFLSLLVAN
jgi:hypothetical protein